MDSVGEGEGGEIWEHSIETCIISCMKQVASPGSMHGTGYLGLVHWDDPEGGYPEAIHLHGNLEQWEIACADDRVRGDDERMAGGAGGGIDDQIVERERIGHERPRLAAEVAPVKRRDVDEVRQPRRRCARLPASGRGV